MTSCRGVLREPQVELVRSKSTGSGGQDGGGGGGRDGVGGGGDRGLTNCFHSCCCNHHFSDSQPIYLVFQQIFSSN